jgi:uncharacterized membrane protein
MGTKILQAALALHERVSSTFRKTAVNFHYEFTVRTQWHLVCLKALGFCRTAVQHLLPRHWH